MHAKSLIGTGRSNEDMRLVCCFHYVLPFVGIAYLVDFVLFDFLFCVVFVFHCVPLLIKTFECVTYYLWGDGRGEFGYLLLLCLLACCVCLFCLFLSLFCSVCFVIFVKFLFRSLLFCFALGSRKPEPRPGSPRMPESSPRVSRKPEPQKTEGV